MTKKNIILFLPNFSPGGAAASIIRMIKKIDKNKFNIFVISIGKNFYKKTLNQYCKKIIELHSNRTFSSFLKIIKIIINFKKEKIIFISNINYANVLSLVFLKIIYKFKNLKLVLIERTPLNELTTYYDFIDFFKKKIVISLIYIFYKKADLIICNSLKASSDFKKLSKKKIYTVYPQPIISNKKFFKRKIKNYFEIMTIARLSKEKRIQDIIMAVSYTNLEKVRLNVIGDGDLKNKLIELAKLRNINVKFVSYSLVNEKKYFKKANLYINSSDFEGFPSTVVQALNESIPVISSKSHGGIYEILNYGKLGKLFNPRDYIELSENIKKIYSNYDKIIYKLKKNKNYLNKFLNKKNFDKYNCLFEGIK